jgi:hypothetical protein
MSFCLIFLFAVCDSNKPLDDPDPSDDVVDVQYADFMTQIRLPENYPEPQKNIRIAVFNCDGKSSSPFSHISVFV